MTAGTTRGATSPAKSGQEDDTEFVETPQLRMLRYAVIGMGVVLIVGFIVILGRIFYLASRPGALASAPAATHLAAEPRLDLPNGASIKSLSLSGNRLAIQYVSPNGDGIAILDLESGRTLSRLKVTSEAKP
jgi:hypothetical protein